MGPEQQHSKFSSSIGPAGNIRGFKHKLARQPTKNCDQREHFFLNRVIPTRNKLPNYVVESGSVNIFKNNLDKFYNKGQNIKKATSYHRRVSTVPTDESPVVAFTLLLLLLLLLLWQ